MAQRPRRLFRGANDGSWASRSTGSNVVLALRFDSRSRTWGHTNFWSQEFDQESTKHLFGGQANQARLDTTNGGVILPLDPTIGLQSDLYMQFTGPPFTFNNAPPVGASWSQTPGQQVPGVGAQSGLTGGFDAASSDPEAGTLVGGSGLPSEFWLQWRFRINTALSKGWCGGGGLSVPDQYEKRIASATWEANGGNGRIRAVLVEDFSPWNSITRYSAVITGLKPAAANVYALNGNHPVRIDKGNTVREVLYSCPSDPGVGDGGSLTVVSGTAAAYTRAAADPSVRSLTIKFSNSPDLSGFATDGSVAIWVNSLSDVGSFGGLKVGTVVGVDNTAKTVTCSAVSAGTGWNIPDNAKVDYTFGLLWRPIEGSGGGGKIIIVQPQDSSGHASVSGDEPGWVLGYTHWFTADRDLPVYTFDGYLTPTAQTPTVGWFGRQKSGTTYAQYPGINGGVISQGFLAASPAYTYIEPDTWHTLKLHMSIGHWYMGPHTQVRNRGGHWYNGSQDQLITGGIKFSFSGGNTIVRDVGRWDTTDLLTASTTAGAGSIYAVTSNTSLTHSKYLQATAISGDGLTLTVQEYQHSQSTVTFTNSTDVVNWTSHGLVNGDTVVFFAGTGTMPSGLSANTRYFVVNKTANDFQVSATSGGSAINFTTDGSGTLTAAGSHLAGTPSLTDLAAYPSAGNVAYPILMPAGTMDYITDGTYGAVARWQGLIPLRSATVIAMGSSWSSVEDNGGITRAHFGVGYSAHDSGLSWDVPVYKSSDLMTLYLKKTDGTQPTQYTAGALYTLSQVDRQWRDTTMDLFYAPQGGTLAKLQGGYWCDRLGYEGFIDNDTPGVDLKYLPGAVGSDSSYQLPSRNVFKFQWTNFTNNIARLKMADEAQMILGDIILSKADIPDPTDVPVP